MNDKQALRHFLLNFGQKQVFLSVFYKNYKKIARAKQLNNFIMRH